MNDYRFDDFTETGYCTALELARRRWRFESFGSASRDTHILWRHDIDVSPHRAARLAELENERGLKATYFFLLHSEFYNCLEAGVRDIARRIRALGHDIGLHFDIAFYDDVADVPSLEKRIAKEASLISDLALAAPTAVSFHNPTEAHLAKFDQPRLAGLVNAYGKPIRTTYQYISDSNGYWRFNRLHDVLAADSVANLHVLTHPEWWTPDVHSPRARIARAVEGRAARVLQEYDAFLEMQRRPNVR